VDIPATLSPCARNEMDYILNLLRLDEQANHDQIVSIKKGC